MPTKEELKELQSKPLETKYPVYLDYAASAPTTYWGWDFNTGTNYNPNQPYAISEQKQLKEAESIVLEALGSKTGHVIFGANATIMGKYLADLYNDFFEPCAISAFEHDCLAYVTKYKPVSPYMFVGKTVEGLKRWLKENEDRIKESNETCSPCSCIWMFVQNLTGEIMPVQEIGNLVHQYGMHMVCDLTAGLHNEPVPDNIDDWCDIAIWSGSKVGAEKGTGGIWFSERAWKEHCIGDEPPLHFGTPNAAQAMAQAQAIKHCQNEVSRRLSERYRTWRYIDDKWITLWQHLTSGIIDIRADYSDIIKQFRLGDYEFSSGIVGLYLPDINADAFQQFASTRQVYFSVFHSACAGQGDYRVAEAYGLTKEQASHCVRLSFGYETSEQDIDRFIEVLKEFREVFCSDGVCEAKKELAGRGILVELSK